MDRKEAVTIVKQICKSCSLMEGKTIKLMPPKASNSLSNTYQIHIETKDEIILACAKAIAKKHNLAVKQKEGSVIVYKPYPDDSAR